MGPLLPFKPHSFKISSLKSHELEPHEVKEINNGPKNAWALAALGLERNGP
jgi:hypothetical protein